MSYKFSLYEALNTTEPELAVLLQQQDLADPQTATTNEQTRCEVSIAAFFRQGSRFGASSKKKVRKLRHKEFLVASLGKLGVQLTSLDSSRPWLCYWTIHTLNVLGFVQYEGLPEPESEGEAKHTTLPVSATIDEITDLTVVSEFLFDRLYDPVSGGFRGGIDQMAHLAPTYAAVNAICTVGTKQALDRIDRKRLYDFISSLKDKESGGFRMHDDGEIDIRAVYCAMSVAYLTNILDDKLAEGVNVFIRNCQTYEGGIGGEPGAEAHGGYTFCGLASAILLGCHQQLDLSSLLFWLTQKQMSFEGGFQGRTNKLVDSCYSFWQGACFPLLQEFAGIPGVPDGSSSWLMDQIALQDYIVLCCQNQNGGMFDKPGKPRDLYHSCYAITGLSISQNNGADVPPTLTSNDPDDLLNPVDPRFGIVRESAQRALCYFQSLPPL